MENDLIVITGICASGKTTLVNGLKELGYNARSVAQEHSHAPRLWSLRNPDFLAVLDCDYETVRKRRPVSYGPDRVDDQRLRLANAREHCDLYLKVDDLTPEEVRERVVREIEKKRLRRSEVG